MALALTLGLSFDGVDDLVLSLLDGNFIDFSEALDNVVADGADVPLLKFSDVLDKRLDGFTSGEEGAYRVIDGEIGQPSAQDLVAQVHHAQGMVDEQVTAHKLIDEIFLHQKGSRILGKDCRLIEIIG